MPGNLRLIKNEKSDEFERKVRRHKMAVFFRTFLILAVLIASATAGYIIYSNMSYDSYIIISKSMRTDSDTARYLPYNGNIIKYSQDGAEAFDGSNRALWNVTYEMQDPHIAICEGYVAMGDLGSTSILVMDSTGTQTEIKTKLPITNFCVAGQGVVAAVLDDGLSSSQVAVYDKSGANLVAIKCTMSQSGYPMDLSLSPDGKLLCISYMRVESGKPCTSVAFYNFGDVGQNEIDNYVSGYDYENSIFPRVRFLNDSTAVAIGSDRVVMYSGSQKPESISENAVDEEIRGVFFGDERVGVVYGLSGGAFRLDVYNGRGRLELSREFDLVYTDIEIGNRQIVVYNDKRCEIFSMRGGLKYSGDFEDSTILMAPTRSQSKYILVNRNTVQTIRLR